MQTSAPQLVDALVIGDGDPVLALNSISAEVPFRATVLPSLGTTAPDGLSHSIAFVCVPRGKCDGACSTIEQLGRHLPDLPVIAWTESIDEAAAVQLLKKGASEVLPMPMASAAAVRTAIGRAMARHKLSRNGNGDGDGPVHVTVSRLLSDGDGPVHVTVSRLLSENKDLRNFAHIVAHDLQSPLVQIGSFSDLCELSIKGGEVARACQFLDRIRSSAARMKQFISGLHDLSSATDSTAARENVDLGGVVREVIGDLSARIRALGAKIAVGELPTVHARRFQMYQVYFNLLDNALKYAGSAPPRIQIGSAKSDGGWRLWVSDNGIGIEPSDITDIFELFRRSSGVSHVEGRGIGLTICKRIIESHGGRIWVESRKTDGSCFYFTLPGRFDPPARNQAI
jgi:signal transduction histidine kinase